jgi:LysR family transcriptional regulator, regulator of abg operon
MDTRHLRAFQAIVECGSIRAAARRLGVSQPALSKTLHQLEATLGAPLILRSVNGAVPTECGRALMVRATLISEELRRATEEITQLSGNKSGNVAISTSAVGAFLMATEALKRFWRRYPEAKVRIIDGVFEIMLSDLQSGRLDFSIGPLPRVALGPDVTTEVLFENVIVPVVRKSHPLVNARSLRDLQKCTWLLTGAYDSADLIAENFGAHGLSPPHVSVACESFPALIELVVGTDLVTALPLSLLHHRLIGDLMKPIKIKEELRSTAMALITRTGVPLTPLAEALAHEYRLLARRYARPRS